jgi:hypothetical protein
MILKSARAGSYFRACLALAVTLAGTNSSAQAIAGATKVVALPRVFSLRAEALADAKRRITAHDPSITPAFKQLLEEADKALTAPNVAVTDKRTLLPPSGDKHDYFSLSPYWWPDPSKPNGLPYIRRDGETNPESKADLDQPRIAAMGANVSALALAWYFTGDEKYATKAASQLRAWFLDPATKMNPHLRFSQLVKGNDAERGSGIVDTRWFIEAVNSAGMLNGSRSWTASDDSALRGWFGEYLKWLLTSPNGRHEQAAKNNHGSWFAAQTATYALYVGDTTRAREIATNAKARIGWQITNDGTQPIELERTRSMHYSGFNVEALSRLAEVGDKVGVDLWHFQAPQGGSLQKAIRNLARYTGSAEKWPGNQIDAVGLDLLLIHFRRDLRILGDREMIPVLERLPKDQVARDRSELLYPEPR